MCITSRCVQHIEPAGARDRQVRGHRAGRRTGYFRLNRSDGRCSGIVIGGIGMVAVSSRSIRQIQCFFPSTYSTNVRQRARMVVSPAWLQVVLVTFLIGFAILGYLAYRIYADHPPVPGTVVSDKGEAVFTGERHSAGTGVVFHLWAHAIRLDLRTRGVSGRTSRRISAPGGPGDGERYGGGPEAQERARIELRENRYDPKTDMLLVNEAQLQAFRNCSPTTKSKYSTARRAVAVSGPAAVRNSDERKKIVALHGLDGVDGIGATSGKPVSLHQPGRRKSSSATNSRRRRWRGVRFDHHLAGRSRLVLGRSIGNIDSVVGWHGEEQKRVQVLPPGDVALTPSQRSVAWYFFIVMALFFLQTLLGGATTHYHAETGGFFGFDLAK